MTEEVTTATKPRASRAKTAPEEATEAEGAALPTSIIHIIPLIRAEVGAIAKGQSTKSGPSYAYRSTDDIIDALAPLFSKYGVFTTVNDLEHSMDSVVDGKRVTTTVIIRKEVRFYGPDGQYVTSTVSGEGADFSDKATNKAGTYAYRVALVQTFTLPTGEKDEGGEYIEKAPNAKVAAAISSAARPTAAPANAETLAISNLRNAVKAAAGIKGMDSKALNALGQEIAGEGVPVEEWFSNGDVLNAMIQKMSA